MMKEKILNFLGIRRVLNKVNAATLETTEALQDRVLLAQIELQEEFDFAKKRFWQLVFLIGVSINLVPLLCLGVILLFWDSPYRQWIILSVLGVWVLCTISVLVAFLCGRRKKPAFFALRRELAQDIANLQAKMRKGNDGSK